MTHEAILKQLGYVPNDSLYAQIEEIEKNTTDYEKIIKHILDLHEHLKVNNGFVALSNSKNYFKIKIDAPTPALEEEAHEKVEHFAKKFKVKLQKLPNKSTYYILGYEH